ncbi:hypothetical protein [Streptococcus ruminantium]|uniref:hypothetical protein n=1 Tax=Streptococcus ruminantium TaxID=1917441 RepID=UPI0012DDC7ED|nr:hypothetical protein [Streptococcus ruminantium]
MANIQSNPIQSNPIQSNPIQSNPIQSNPIQSNPIQSNPADYVAIQPFCQPLKQAFSHFCERVFYIIRNEVA